MVSQDNILASNALINDAVAPRVSVFVGGTSGIGKLTIGALVSTGASLRIYLIGRPSSEERSLAYIKELNAINPKAEIFWTEAEISLLAETKRVCDIIKIKESKVDLLFMTAGYAPLGGREETSEGLEIVQTLEYYSRMLFIQLLLPLLAKSEAPRVVSVLSGGLERGTIDLEDLEVRKASRFRFAKAQTQFGAMNTTTLDKLARENPDITFMHSWPGWVNTGNVHRGVQPGTVMSWFIWLVLNPLISFFSFTDEVSAQRNLFQATSSYYGGKGTPWTGEPGVNTLGKTENGLFLVNYKCDATPNAKTVSLLRKNAQEGVWEHTQEILSKYL